jgi:hypothetical protein
MPFGKIDFRREYKALYVAGAGPALVEVPELQFLMVDGAGDPNGSQEYHDAVQALFSVSYALKFAVKRAADGMDYKAMPLEGLWWVDDISRFSFNDRSDWRWTVMILQPAVVTEELLAQAVEASVAKRRLPAAGRLRLERFEEGEAAQVLHAGPYSAERPTISRLHDFIEEQGSGLRGKHREIYLTDPSRTARERLKTILRQPVRGRPHRATSRTTGAAQAVGQPAASSVN